MVRPGVYVSEAPLARVIDQPGATASYGAFLGKALRGPTEPTRVNSWSDFVATFGGFTTQSTLAPALFQYFSNGGGPAYVCRVLNSTGTAKASAVYPGLPDPDRLRFTALTAGQWGNALYYTIDEIVPASTGVKATFSLTIKDTVRGAKVAVERFKDLSMTVDEPRYILDIVNSTTIGSRYVSVEDLSPLTQLQLTKAVTEQAFAGGLDGTGDPSSGDYSSAFQKFDDIDALLVVNCPGVTDVSAIATYIQDGRGDSIVIIDPPENQVPRGPTGNPPPTLPGMTLPKSSYCAMFYPWIHISDPAPDAPRGSIVKVPPGASVAGMILRTDATRGVFKAPAGTGATLSGVVATERRLSNDDLDAIAAAKVNAIRALSGTGITVMGARTFSSDVSQYISVRRTLNWVKKKAVETSRFALFEPNTPRLWSQLRVANGSYLSQLWEAGGLAGKIPSLAYYVKCDADINTPQTIQNGELHIEIGVSPVYPAEYIIIRVGAFEADASVVASEEGLY